ncbi:metal ABC transporter permease, partial [Yoonia sp.]|uniref:metal ABC transporter permease n=1 Tax=Yoonia sp. TaxID=2212373 RepID=UPI003F71E017
MTAIIDLFSSDIVQTVLIGAALLGAISGMLGAFAVLRRQSLLGDALSHAALPGVCLGFLIAGGRDLGSVMVGAFATGALAALVMMLIVRRTTLKTDAALGIVLSVFFAVGIVLLTVIQTQGGSGSLGLMTFLFGQAAAILRSDLWVMGGV